MAAWPFCLHKQKQILSLAKRYLQSALRRHKQTDVKRQWAVVVLAVRDAVITHWTRDARDHSIWRGLLQALYQTKSACFTYTVIFRLPRDCGFAFFFRF